MSIQSINEVYIATGISLPLVVFLIVSLARYVIDPKKKMREYLFTIAAIIFISYCILLEIILK